MVISHFTHRPSSPLSTFRDFNSSENTWARLRLWATSIVVSINKALWVWEEIEIEAIKTRVTVFHAVHLFHVLKSRQWTQEWIPFLSQGAEPDRKCVRCWAHQPTYHLELQDSQPLQKWSEHRGWGSLLPASRMKVEQPERQGSWPERGRFLEASQKRIPLDIFAQASERKNISCLHFNR